MSKQNFHLTFTGIYGDMRRHGREKIHALGMEYSGSLLIGETTHLILDHTSAVSTASEKVSLALEYGIPLVSYQWIDDSYASSRILPLDAYYITFSQEAAETLDAPAAAAPPSFRSRRTSSRHPSFVQVEQLRDAAVQYTPSFAASSFALLSENSPSERLVAAQHSSSPFADLPSPQRKKSPDISCLPPFSHDFRSYEGSPGLPTIPEGPEGDDEGSKSIDDDVAHLQHRFQTHAALKENSAPSKPSQTTKARITGSSAPVSRPSLSKFAPKGAHRFTVSTAIPCAPLSAAPGAVTFAAIREKHGPSRAVTFYSSAQIFVDPESARKTQLLPLSFTAGDAAHGAKILYDNDRKGNQIFAHVLIKSFYCIDSGRNSKKELWMEHHYLFNAEDFAERPAWTAALQAQPIGNEELLVSANTYHSPCEIIVGEFGVEIAAESKQRSRKGAQRERALSAKTAASRFSPVLRCWRGFDAALKRVVPLSKALKDFKM